jgi:hypothetical protein
MTQADGRPARAWLILTLLLWCAAATAATPEANVDRAVVGEGDSITLTIRRAGPSGGDSPDYGVLTRDFHQYGSGESSRHVISNGRAESWTEWQTTLIPKRSGQLVIPPIPLGAGKTAPIAIQVNPASATAATRDEPLFIEASIDSDSVYVQQQLLLTVRVFHAVRLDDMNLTEPELDNANVEKVSQESFRRDVDGITYQVHELVYAIFPREAGELTIPELVFSARQPQRTRSFFDFPGQGRGLRRLSRQFNVQVKPIPPQFSGGTWLPARTLTLVESWSGNPQQLTVGETITRTLTLQADGLTATQLPQVEVPTLAEGKLYADQPQLDDRGDSRGVLGKRVESMALIPTQAGQMALPATRIRWWDVTSDSEKVAELPAQILTIRPAAGAAAPAGTQPPAGSGIAADGGAPTAVAAGARGWQIATAALALAWLLTLGLLWRQRRPAAAAAIAPPPAREDEKPLFAVLEQACRRGDAVAARQALLRWAARYYGISPVTLEWLITRSDDPALRDAVQAMERQLFGGDGGAAWEGEALLRAVGELRRKRPARNGDGGEALPGLYPA